MNNKIILVTGAAGFIGMHTSLKLLERGESVVGLDNLNDYYDPALKIARLGVLSKYPNFKFVKGDILDRNLIFDLFLNENFGGVVHLAAQAGVRYSVTNPFTYGDCNLTGFLNILEACRENQVSHLVYASSSSVYGGNKTVPFSEKDSVDQPLSLYAATKRANELMSYCYSHLYNIPITGLRFFTVYGPWGRPDQSLFLFVSAILAGKPINIFNNGLMSRDFTYIDDIVDGIIKVLDKPPTAVLDNVCERIHSSRLVNSPPQRIFNIGNGVPVALLEFILVLEKALKVTAIKNFLPMQAGDVIETYADTTALEQWIGFKPRVMVEEGVENFIKWYQDYYAVRP